MLRQAGSMAGKGIGNCTGGQNRNRAMNMNGRGNIGRGMCNNWFNASDLASHSAQETEQKFLMEQAAALNSELELINKRLRDLGN